MSDLIEKYYPIISSVNKSLWNDYAETLESCVNYLNPKTEISKDLKVAATYVVKQLFLDDDDFKTKNITTTIDEFIKYHGDEYDNYINGFALITDQFDADLSFYYLFIKNHQPF